VCFALALLSIRREKEPDITSLHEANTRLQNLSAADHELIENLRGKVDELSGRRITYDQRRGICLNVDRLVSAADRKARIIYVAPIGDDAEVRHYAQQFTDLLGEIGFEVRRGEGVRTQGGVGRQFSEGVTVYDSDSARHSPGTDELLFHILDRSGIEVRRSPQLANGGFHWSGEEPGTSVTLLVGYPTIATRTGQP
jgi:hypothetical protein